MDQLTKEEKALLDDYFQNVENRISHQTCEILNTTICMFYKFVGISPEDRDKSLDSLLNSKNVLYSDPEAYEKIEKLLNDEKYAESFKNTLNGIRKAVTEKKTVDMLRKEVITQIDKEILKNEFIKHVQEAIINVKEDKNGHFKIQNLISEANKLGLDGETVMSEIVNAALDPILSYDKRTAILSITEIQKLSN